MKNQIKSLLLVAFMLGTVIPAWSQASTQGTEFWVSSSIVCSPSNGKGIDPYLAVSAEKACTVTITDYQGNSVLQTDAGGQVLQNVSVSAGSWTEFGTKVNSDPSNGPIQVYLAPAKWYPIATKEPATVCNLAGQRNMYGLHITATEKISVYVILRGESSMDASNILPINALGAEYYVQDFKPEAHNDKSWNTNEGNMVTVTTILGTEDGTQVDITPSNKTFDNHAAGTTYTIDLNKGQTYYLISQKEQQLAGTHIKAKNGRKIAIYTGSPLTRLPNGVSARDALFEQPMPVEYWGTQFIVTRSLGKNGNIIGITASNDGTEIRLDGYSQNIFIDKGETYYIVLQNAGKPQANKPGTSSVDNTFTGDVLYIETSCPCQVYSYDTGNAYVGKEKDVSGTVINELVEGEKGDPSSVWVSPIQQKINKITFGACYTNLTEAHFLNVITETSNCQNTILSILTYDKIAKKDTIIDKSNLLSWQTVPGNTKYSYARVQIGNKASKDYPVFRLENSKGFIATVYGNGNDESYAYSAGSAAVELGINVNGETFVEGYRSDSKFCIADSVKFDAGIGTDEVTRVDWNFGDGTTLSYGEPQVEHKYLSPGWYDVTAVLYGTQACSGKGEQHLGDVHFSFRVVKQDTLIGGAEYHCLPIDTLLDDPERRAYLLEHGETKIITPKLCYEPVYINYVRYGEHA
ncbi:MAG: PKD domain-containing protein, partial [Paludibacteraceae bacterium]|nr:PKD domain-containing protein [Paludibacteraceae bacterium]